MTRTHVLLCAAAVLALAALMSGGNVVSLKASSAAVPVAELKNLTPVPAGQRTALLSDSSGLMTLDARLSSDRVLAGSSTLFMETNLRAAAPERQAQRLPVNLAVALDRSGSMSGNKLDQAKKALLALIAALGPTDRLAVVSFGSDVTVFPSTRVDDAGRAALVNFAQGIDDAGGTNISGALDVAYEQLRHVREGYKVSRVILLSDGQPTEGETSQSALLARVEHARGDDITTSAFGVGLDFNSRLMSALSGAGAGSYAFIEDANQVASIFERDLANAGATVARRVELWIRTRPGVVVAEVPGHTFDIREGGVRVPVYDFSPGQSAQTVVRFELAGVPSEGTFPLAEVAVRYVDTKDELAKEAHVTFTPEVTTRPEEVAAHADGVLQTLVQRLEVSKQLAAAATAYESGDRQGSLNIFDGIRRQFGMSADALGGVDMTATERQLRNGNAEGARAAKMLTDKTMKNFGQNNAY